MPGAIVERAVAGEVPGSDDGAGAMGSDGGMLLVAGGEAMREAGEAMAMDWPTSIYNGLPLRLLWLKTPN